MFNFLRSLFCIAAKDHEAEEIRERILARRAMDSLMRSAYDSLISCDERRRKKEYLQVTLTETKYVPDHTPGPWVYEGSSIGDPDNTLNPIVWAESGPYIARLFSSKSTLRGLNSIAPGQAEADANACLIAASPDLLAACNKWVEGWGEQFDEASIRKWFEEMKKITYAAIEKARSYDTTYF